MYDLKKSIKNIIEYKQLPPPVMIKILQLT